MASLDSSLSEADRMAQGACDGAETMRPDYASSGGFIGTGPDSARHGSSVDGSQSFMRTPVLAEWSVHCPAQCFAESLHGTTCISSGIIIWIIAAVPRKANVSISLRLEDWAGVQARVKSGLSGEQLSDNF